MYEERSVPLKEADRATPSSPKGESLREERKRGAHRAREREGGEALAGQVPRPKRRVWRPVLICSEPAARLPCLQVVQRAYDSRRTYLREPVYLITMLSPSAKLSVVEQHGFHRWLFDRLFWVLCCLQVAYLAVLVKIAANSYVAMEAPSILYIVLVSPATIFLECSPVKSPRCSELSGFLFYFFITGLPVPVIQCCITYAASLDALLTYQLFMLSQPALLAAFFVGATARMQLYFAAPLLQYTQPCFIIAAMPTVQVRA